MPDSPKLIEKLSETTGRRPDWWRRHLWEIQPIRDGLVIAAVVGIIWLGYRLSIVTVPILLALLLAYLFEPLVRRATRRRWMSREGTAISIIVVAALAFVAPLTAGLGFAAIQGVNYTREVVTNVQALRASADKPDDAKLREALPEGAWQRIRDYIVEAQIEEQRRIDSDALRLAGVEPADDADTTLEETKSALRQAAAWVFHLLSQTDIEKLAATLGRQAIGTGADAAKWVLGAVTSLGFVVFNGFLTAFFFYFFCTGYGRVLAFWEKLIPERRKERVFDLLSQMDKVIAGFVRGRLTICFALMLYFTMAYWLVGVPAPLVLGPIIGLLSLMPYVAGIGMPIAALLMWLEPTSMGWQSAWWWIIGGPILVTTGAQILDDYVLTPAIQGKSTGMDTPTIVFASIAGGALAGVYGLLLAIPVAACLKIMIREVVWPRFRQWAEGRSPDPLPIDPNETMHA